MMRHLSILALFVLQRISQAPPVDYLPRQTLNHLHNGWLENPYRKLHLLDYSIRKRKADKESSKLSKSQCQNTFPHYQKNSYIQPTGRPQKSFFVFHLTLKARLKMTEKC